MEQLIIEKYNYPTVHKVDILSSTLALTFNAFDDGRCYRRMDDVGNFLMT